MRITFDGPSKKGRGLQMGVRGDAVKAMQVADNI